MDTHRVEIPFKVLIVEDETSNRVLLRRLIGKLGLESEEASDGIEGLELFAKSKFDIVLVDLLMPRMGGLEVCERLRENYSQAELPIIVVTSKGEVSDLALSFKAGANDYITKPINSQILLARLNSQILILESAREIARVHNKLAQTKRMETIGQLAAGVAHNFNNMLGTIMGSADLAILDSDENSPVVPHLEMILKAAERGASLTDSLLTFAVQSEENSCSDVTEIMNSLANLARVKTGDRITFELKSEANLPTILISSSALGSVLLALIDNSIEAICEEGSVTLTVHKNNREGVNYVEFSIADTGSGIPANIAEHAFEPFFSTKNLSAGGHISYDGSGLGLSTAYNLIYQAGGSIHVASSSSEGTIIKFSVPCA